MNRFLTALVLAFATSTLHAQVTLDAQGWTQVALSPDSRVVYVDPARPDDSGDGLSPATAEKTIAAGIADLRDKYPDHLRLKSGATFTKGFGWFKKSGRSHDEPMVIETYGGPDRVKIRAGAHETAFYQNGWRVDHLFIFDVDMEPVGRNGTENPRGIEILGPASDLHLENVRIARFQTNLVFQKFVGVIFDVQMRRCQVLDAWGAASTGHSNGMYVDGTFGLVMFETLLDHCGYSSPTLNVGANSMRHNFYGQNGCGPITAVSCVSSRASATGLMIRGGGTVRGCVFYQCPIALVMGGGNTPDPGGVVANVHGNIILSGTNLDAANPRGWGIVFANVRAGMCDGNVIAHNNGTLPSAVSMENTTSIGVDNLTISNNVIHDWHGGLVGATNNFVHNLVQTNNDWNQPASKYKDATKTVAPDWLTAVRTMHKGNWDSKRWARVSREILTGYKLK